ncbi:YqaJ viral recombinase family protein [Variovorax sp. ZT5P49]|uniref:YqaJ viral recombinase family protein n=1 Tax=Variovorax sp. ZT5P49 TaxID=3443733 RepID=UPI003F488914
METLNLVQGTPEWHAHRRNHFNASDAPAMLGVSRYKTRTQLLHEMATGDTPEVDAATQKRFDYGHRFEALARPLAEEFIGEELFPVVGALGKLSASFDGLTMDETIGFEHKTLNADLRAAMAGGSTGASLPADYRAQMEQQLMISGAEKILFVASSWRGDDLIEEQHCWYESDPVMRAALQQGWAQFEIDLAAYKPAHAAAEPVGRTPETLPALRVEVTGMVTASNLAEFKAHAFEVFAGINTTLETDQHFADADKTVKWCGDVEERLAAAKQHALSQTESIDMLFRTIDDIAAEARRVRLDLSKKIDSEKLNRRNKIMADGAAALTAHVHSLNERLGVAYMPLSAAQADFAGAMKGKKTIASLKEAVSTTLANAKIAASAVADKIEINLKALARVPDECRPLFPDAGIIVQKANDDFEALVTSRLAAHKAAEDAKEAGRMAAVAQVAVPVPAPAAAPIAVAAVVQRVVPAPQAAPNTPPSLRLGVLNERLAPIQITAGGLASLGFTAAARQGSTVLYHETDYPRICAALIDHLQQVVEPEAAAA